MKTHLPVTIVSGFLGSGKTTLINRILKEQHGIQFALIINEFGEVGLDGGLVRGPQDFVKMDNGCLCCVLSDELVKTIEALKQRDDYDAVVLETTGIADPLPVAWPFLREEFADKFRFSGIITVVDCLHLDQMLAQSEEAELQIERADYLYLSKTDLCSVEDVDGIRSKLIAINANARIVDGADSNALALMFDGAKVTLPKQETHHHHDSTKYQTISISLQDQELCLEDVEDLFEELPKSVFRAKAVFKDRQRKKMIAIHSVCGRVDWYLADDYTGSLAMVFIGKGLPEADLELKVRGLF